MTISNQLYRYGFSVAGFCAVLAWHEGTIQTALAGPPVDVSAQEMSAHAHALLTGGSASPHQMEKTDAHAGDGFASGAERTDVSWTLPSEWKELPPTAMRLGNFASTKNGQKVEITVASLPGPAGGVGANFDMWRSQLGLPEIEQSELLKLSSPIKVAGVEMTSIDLVSTENILEGKYKGRILGAIYQGKSNTWFFKMKGEDNAVTSTKKEFMTFLDSVKFKE